jgi:hypothetical protein
MKRLFLFYTILLFHFAAFAQHPLVGTWEMVSIKGLNAEGESFYLDTTSVRETKIITPTHYILIATDVIGDSLAFNRSYSGTVTVKGDKYIEQPLISSLPIFDNVKTDYNWKIEGDKFIQSGTVVRPDGKKVFVEALVFRRVRTKHSYPENPVIGTWDQISSSFINFDGTKEQHTNKTTQRLHVITPTHWMRISQRGHKFEHAMMGTYTMKGKTVIPVLQYSSVPMDKTDKVELTEKINGNKLYVHGVLTNAARKQFIWDDVFVRVE